MYEVKGKVRYSETDSEGKLTIPALLNYFQDSSTFQSESLGVGVKTMMENNLAWVLSSWQICINQMPNLAEDIKTQTWPTDFKGFFGTRNFCMKTEEDKMLAYANSIWVLIDIRTGKPTRVPDFVANSYQNEPPIPMECSERKIKAPAEYVEKDPIPVLKFFIDTNKHVNNEKYVMIAQEFLPEEFDVGEIRVEYRKAAVLNDTWYPRVTEEAGRITVNLTDEDGKTYAIILFLKRN
jgi:acyl-ACP thioesterase